MKDIEDKLESYKYELDTLFTAKSYDVMCMHWGMLADIMVGYHSYPGGIEQAPG